MLEHIYLRITLVLVILWLVLFWANKNQRREMLIMGIILAIAAPIQELWYTQDYWHPDYIGPWPWVEDMLFGFSIIGVAATLYELAFNPREVVKYRPHPLVFFSVILIGFLGLGLFSVFMNSIYAATLSFLIAWSIVILVRPDLLVSSMWAAVFLVLLTFLGYQIVLYFYPNLITSWWDLNNISGVTIFKVPLEEYLWFATLGLFAGSAYEVFKGVSFRKI